MDPRDITFTFTQLFNYYKLKPTLYALKGRLMSLNCSYEDYQDTINLNYKDAGTWDLIIS